MASGETMPGSTIRGAAAPMRVHPGITMAGAGVGLLGLCESRIVLRARTVV